MDLKAIYLDITKEQDPLLPFESGFKSSVEWLSRLEKTPEDSEIIFRTRSPLVILLVPIFKRFHSRMRFIIPIEALTDSLHTKLDPESKLPRPSERIKAAKALHSLGLDVELELRPFISATPTTYEIPTRLVKTFAKICDESASKVFLRQPLKGSGTSKTEFYFSHKLGGHLMSARLIVESESARCAA